MTKNKNPWPFLNYWNTGEWQVVEERLRDITRKRLAYCPGRANLFTALDRTPFDKVNVMVVGQDPYPTLGHATGVAFEVPEELTPDKFPPTLKNIFQEYQDDLGYPAPRSGNLQKWTEQGVLLWNAYPSCLPGQPGSQNWDEWAYLTKEIIQKVTAKGIVIAFLGGKAKEFLQYVDTVNSEILVTSHPSPRGNFAAQRFGGRAFQGSRIFSTINGKLAEGWGGEKVINWRL